jgi:hypothetical protein
VVVMTVATQLQWLQRLAAGEQSGSSGAHDGHHRHACVQMFMHIRAAATGAAVVGVTSVIIGCY